FGLSHGALVPRFVNSLGGKSAPSVAVAVAKQERLERQPAGALGLSHLDVAATLPAPLGQGRVVDAVEAIEVPGAAVGRIDEPVGDHIGGIPVIAFDDRPVADAIDLPRNPAPDFRSPIAGGIVIAVARPIVALLGGYPHSGIEPKTDQPF